MGRLKEATKPPKSRQTKAIGDFLLSRRRALNYTLRDVAELSKLAPTSVWQIENGQVSPHFLTIVKLSEVLQCELDDWRKAMEDASC